MIPDSSFSHPYVIPCLKLGWALLLASNELNIREAMGCQFKDQVLKIIVASFLGSFSPNLYSGGNWLP